jgi:DNA-binding NarL/FixJ family response regulator
MALDGHPFRTPRASAYVVEAHPDAALTEALVSRLLASRPGARLLAVAERFDQRCAFSLLRLGVKGLLSFDEAPAHLVRAVQEILQGGIWVSRSLLSRFIDSTVRSLNPRNPRLLSLGEALSRREHQVCGLLMENLSNREIASRLQVSERTAKFHVSNLLAKYGLKRRADLVVLSYSQSREPNGVRNRSGS